MKKEQTYIYPWHVGSKGARGLYDTLGIRSIRREGSTFTGSAGKVVINWGNSELTPEIKKCAVVNPTVNVNRSSDKLKFFTHQGTEGGRIPPFTTELDAAIDWTRQGKTVVARTKLKARSGAGIVFLEGENISEFVDAPLYTLYIPKSTEWRVHCAFGKQIDIQQKILPASVDRSRVDFRVRNHSSGFIFVRDDIKPPEDVMEQALKAFVQSKLDFGAVDVIYNKSSNKAYVLEINTAPGLEGQTLKSYAAAFEANL